MKVYMVRKGGTDLYVGKRWRANCSIRGARVYKYKRYAELRIEKHKRLKFPDADILEVVEFDLVEVVK